jgi:hypothetical protein
MADVALSYSSFKGKTNDLREVLSSILMLSALQGFVLGTENERFSSFSVTYSAVLTDTMSM